MRLPVDKKKENMKLENGIQMNKITRKICTKEIRTAMKTT